VIASGVPTFDVHAGFASNGYAEHSPGGYSLLACLVAEVVLTAFFLIVIMGSTDVRAPKGFAPIGIGLCLTLIHLVGIPVTNTSVNPARSTGPALFVGGWALQQLWLFWVAPLIGGALGGGIYAALFSQLDRDDASAIVAKLKELKIPYRVDGDGTTIEVPESRARELRLELAGSGLPRGGGVGFEAFDRMRLGATDFEQRVLYRRALEGELARTIATLDAVESARVHLVLPEKSVFVTRSEPASASIALRLRSRCIRSTNVVGSGRSVTRTPVPAVGSTRGTGSGTHLPYATPAAASRSTPRSSTARTGSGRCGTSASGARKIARLAAVPART